MGAVSSVVKAVVSPVVDVLDAVGLVDKPSAPQPQPQPQPAAAESTSNASTTADQAVSEQPVNKKTAYGGRYASERAMAAKGGAGGGGGGATLLTGPGGAGTTGQELGQKTLLGG